MAKLENSCCLSKSLNLLLYKRHAVPSNSTRIISGPLLSTWLLLRDTFAYREDIRRKGELLYDSIYRFKHDKSLRWVFSRKKKQYGPNFRTIKNQQIKFCIFSIKRTREVRIERVVSREKVRGGENHAVQATKKTRLVSFDFTRPSAGTLSFSWRKTKAMLQYSSIV